MSRVAKQPILVPNNIEIKIDNQKISMKGKNGKINYLIHQSVHVNYTNNFLICKSRNGYVNGWAQAGTVRAILNSMIYGINNEFVKKLQLVGIGYRASIQNNIITLYLGFSHLINHKIPSEVYVECPNQNEIVLKSFNKQLVGQVAADLRSYRPPESYKGKGIRYIDEKILIKETKKK
ncbi:50S ribosomal protein L6 [Candidatus Tachikawaea gelatinosa]|uniref:50S ribosomal protein L6 n=1 Tax=Candidatus Tachikawaea gelatinosa TaxID=1410383 RepID=A0A090ARG0_9ENTR|nr:50S ribosomal protein L6 [Candidatus Tachikawaea gelatinosa]BAP58360.1 50S ribosomal protein L6 [Candidatus Tachikawaea gelatinosa]